MRAKKAFGMPHILVAFGTRPEAIKLAPVLRALKRHPSLRVTTCVTAQHRGLLDQMLEVFGIRPDCDLDIMEKDQKPDDVVERILGAFRSVLRQRMPDLLMVQGDTTTALAVSLSGFYQRIPVAHVEAGLRSFDMKNPYPEEMNRILIDRLSNILFAPTPTARKNLLREGFEKSRIFVSGNTVVDAFQWAAGVSDSLANPIWKRIPSKARLILVTLHRRESFGPPLAKIFKALLQIVRAHKDAVLVFPVHPNPQVRGTAYGMLRHPRIILCDPLPYLDFARLIKRCFFILTDSGGIQEEAPSLQKPVLIVRKVTERPEVIRAGIGKLLGMEPERIVREVSLLLGDAKLYRQMIAGRNPFGDGRAAERIVLTIKYFLGLGPRPRDWGG